MFFSSLIQFVGKKSPVFSHLFIVFFSVVLVSFAFIACDKEDACQEGSNVLVERTFPSNGSVAPHMERPFTLIVLRKSVSVDSLKREVKFLVTDEKGNLQSYTTEFGDEKTTSEFRIFCDGFTPNKKYFVTLRSTNLYYRYGFTIK